MRKKTRWVVPLLLMLLLSAAVLTAAGLWYTAANREFLQTHPVTMDVREGRPLAPTPEMTGELGIEQAEQLLNARGDVAGWRITAAVQGYKSLIRVRATFSADGALLAEMEVLSQNETEYLGERIAGESFAADFRGRKLPLRLTGEPKTGSPVDGLSGSTVSAKAVVTAVNNAHLALEEFLAA